MDTRTERRTEQRLRYHWPVWYAENFEGELTQGQMADVSSHGAAFTCHAHDRSHYPGQWLTARFSVPKYGPDDSFDIADFVRSGQVCRVEDINGHVRKVAVRFCEPLPFKPGEQRQAAAEAESPLEPVLV